MKYLYLIYIVAFSLTFSSCVSTKKFNALDTAYKETQTRETECATHLQNDETQLGLLASQKNDLLAAVTNLNQQLDTANLRYTRMLNTMKTLSVISGTQAEDLKESLETIHKKDDYINSIHDAISSRDSFTSELLINFKNTLNSIADSGVRIKVAKGEIGIDIKNNILFSTEDSGIIPSGKILLGKLASVLNQYPDMKFMVQCCAVMDSIADTTNTVPDPWDLSSKHAASVVRVLYSMYNINPERMALIGKSEPFYTATGDTTFANAIIGKTTIVIPARPDPILDLQVKK